MLVTNRHTDTQTDHAACVTTGRLYSDRKVCWYGWHNAGSLGWPFPTLNYKYIFQIKYTKAILSNSARKLLWFEITKNADCSLKSKFIVLFIIIFGTLSFPMWTDDTVRTSNSATFWLHSGDPAAAIGLVVCVCVCVCVTATNCDWN